MSARGRARALVVPDEETWLASRAAAEPGERPSVTLEPGLAEVLLVPERIPQGLVEAVRAAWAQMPRTRELRTYPLATSGHRAAAVVEHARDGSSGHDGHGEAHEDHAEEGGHAGDGAHDDHEEMMAITGEPSADGLVMEDLDVELGPLGSGLPGGLVIKATLDGDVIASCQIRQELTADQGPPDARAAIAWNVAELAAAEAAAGVAARGSARLFRIAAVEVERALSHVAWLHGMWRLLGWARMAERTRAALGALAAVRTTLPVELATPDLPDAARDPAALEEARERCAALAHELEKSRGLARRTAGLARVEAAEVDARGLKGPVARACGVAHDLRGHEPDYAVIGFEPTLESAGDAHARTLVRVREAAQSLALASSALAAARAADDADEAAAPAAGEVAIEGPRGPLLVRHMAGGRPERSVPGSRAGRELAVERAHGCEWSAGLVAIASFDISPWRVGA